MTELEQFVAMLKRANVKHRIEPVAYRDGCQTVVITNPSGVGRINVEFTFNEEGALGMKSNITEGVVATVQLWPKNKG